MCCALAPVDPRVAPRSAVSTGAGEQAVTPTCAPTSGAISGRASRRASSPNGWRRWRRRGWAGWTPSGRPRQPLAGWSSRCGALLAEAGEPGGWELLTPDACLSRVYLVLAMGLLCRQAVALAVCDADSCPLRAYTEEAEAGVLRQQVSAMLAEVQQLLAAAPTGEDLHEAGAGVVRPLASLDLVCPPSPLPSPPPAPPLCSPRLCCAPAFLPAALCRPCIVKP